MSKVTASDLNITDEVLVDGVKGYIGSINPNGSGVYKGLQHAYIWVYTPSLNFTDTLSGAHHTAGRAVRFADIPERIQLP